MSHRRVPQSPTYPNGCHIVELEIDPETGAASIERDTVVDDFGVTINPLMLEGWIWAASPAAARKIWSVLQPAGRGDGLEAGSYRPR